MASTSAPTSNDILDNARFSTRSSVSSGPQFHEAPTAASVLNAGIDPSSLHPLAGLVDNRQLDYLLLDDDKLSNVEGGQTVLPSRGWGDELCYGTGSTYLCGLAAGGLWGLREGIRKPIIPRSAPTTAAPLSSSAASITVTPNAPPPPPAAGATTAVPPLNNASSIGAQATAFAREAAASASASAKASASASAKASAAAGAGAAGAGMRSVPFRVRWNNILNQVTRRGSFTGNSAGVLALIYNGFNSTLDSYRGGKHDIYGSMAAGACTGALYKCTRGVQPMIVSAGLMTVGAAGWTVLKKQFL